MAYTPVDQLESYTAPTVGGVTPVTAYTFNLAGQPTLVTRADGQELEFTYDTAGRLTELSTPTGDTTYAYHATTGQLTTLTAPSATLTYAYDGALQTSETFAGAVAGAVEWTYDDDFRVTSEKVLGGNTASYTYDDDGLLLSAGAVSYTRDAANGLLTGAAMGSASSTFTYNGFGELASQTTTYGATPLYSATYTRDAGGRLQSQTQTIGGTTTTDAYTYDLAGRLTAVTRDSVPLASYTYDANGNRTSITTSSGTTNATYDAQDRILAFGTRTYTHNAHGDVMSWTESGATTTLTYDTQGNLLQVVLPSATTVSYQVDGRNRRVARLVNGVVTQRFLYQGQLRPVAELDGSGALVSRFVYGDRAIAPEYMVRASVTYRLVTDHLGSVRLVVNTSTGAVAQRLDYGPWGEVVGDTSPGFQPFGYAGGFRDPLTGLVRFGLRDCDPLIGQWLAKDPIGFKGDDANLYRYVGSNPINLVDPLGLEIMPPQSFLTANGPMLAPTKGFSDFSAGIGDGLLLGFGDDLRDALGIDSVDQCSTAYAAGGWASFAFGAARMTYAAAAKGVSILASSGAAASAGREQLKTWFRLGFGKGWRRPNLAGKSDAALRLSAGRTNPWVNAYGAGVAAAGANAGSRCGCP